MIKQLFEKGNIGHKITRNRFVAQPMEGNCADKGGSVLNSLSTNIRI